MQVGRSIPINRVPFPRDPVALTRFVTVSIRSVNFSNVFVSFILFLILFRFRSFLWRFEEDPRHRYTRTVQILIRVIAEFAITGRLVCNWYIWFFLVIFFTGIFCFQYSRFFFSIFKSVFCVTCIFKGRRSCGFVMYILLGDSRGLLWLEFGECPLVLNRRSLNDDV